MRLSISRKQALAKFCKQQHLDVVRLFGSAARGDMHRESDVDVAVLTDHVLTGRERLELLDQLSAFLPLEGRNLDLVDLRTAPPLLVSLILSDGVALFDNGERAETFYRNAIKRVIDAEPLFRLTAEYVQRATSV